ncbi:MAG: DUF4115 domain-containing protein [Wenzhouxiangellaceae bacterium]|nr:DUF4115 domain-containing protein [Wenzhouxiangellaceae bacterium]
MTKSPRSTNPGEDPQLRLAISGPPGAELSAERRRRGLTLEQAARDLKLSQALLARIEADRTDDLAPAFLRGYICNYARLLGMDPEPLLAGAARPECTELRAVLPVAPAGQRFERFSRFATYVLVTTVIVPPLVYFFVTRGVDWFDPGASDERPVAASPSADEPPTTVRSPSVTTRAETLAASALPLTSLSRTPQPDSPASSNEPVDIDTVEAAPVDPRSALMLDIVADSWVEIEDADGNRLEFDLLRAGQQREYRGLAPFELLIGRGNAVRLHIDGAPVAFDGDDADGVVRFEVETPNSPAAASEAG